MSENAKNNLKLLCKNQEGLKVISAYTQDSIVAVKDIVFSFVTSPASTNDTEALRSVAINSAP